MPGRTTLIAISLLAGALALGGCGGDDEPEPSIPLDNASTLVSTLEEVQANVDVGSCIVAEGKVQEFLSELDGLPSGVNDEVVEALERGSQNLLGLIEEDCDRPEETTTEETTTEETTTEETTQTTETTATDTQPTTITTTTPTTPPDNGGGGGVGPPDG
jgi:hypothetical protein